MRKINLLRLLGILMLIPVSFISCSKDDDGNGMSNQDKDKGKGSVSITSIDARKKTTTGLQINVTIKASGVSAGEVKMLGVMGSRTSDAEGGSLWSAVGEGSLSGTAKILAGLTGKTTYYVKAFLKTKEGTVYSSVHTVTTP